MKIEEKLMLYGRSSLSNRELFHLITTNKECNGLSYIKNLPKLTIHELIEKLNITKLQAIRIIASLELNKRIQVEETVLGAKIIDSKSIYEYIRHFIVNDYEQFLIITLNRSNRIINVHKIGEGGLNGTVADPRRILKLALEDKCTSLILVHNHPSNNTHPSESDTKLTNKIVNASKLLDIQVLDHLIIGDNNYYSYADEGNLN